MRYFTGMLLLLISVPVWGQQFGAFPPSVKWKEINTDTARIIFQPSLQMDAKRIATIIHRMAQENANPLGSVVRKINTVLHSHTMLANGYVALAPFRSEYYMIPSTDILSMGANPWAEELAVHEYRHVLQYSNFNRGLSKTATIFLGQEGQALLNSMAIPDWFYEGDAVHAESALTTQGRGRIPYFFNGFRSLFREGRSYSWMKLRNGSLKHYVPDHYQLGYLLVNYGYLKYGNDFWGKVTSDAAAFRPLVYPMQHAIEKYSGKEYKTFREEALHFYKQPLALTKQKETKPETYTNQFFPQFISADSLLYLQTGYKNIPAFYIRNSKGVHRLALKNISTEDGFNYRNGKIIYTAYGVNPRWNLMDYSNIILYNIHTGAETQLTSKDKYLNPDLSPSGEKIIAVHVNEAAQTELQLLTASGDLLKEFTPTDGSFYLHPRFVNNDQVVFVERLANSTMSLRRLFLTTGDVQTLIAPTASLLAYPFAQDGKIYFNASAGGEDAIYVMDLQSHTVQRLVSDETGSYYPAVFKENLAWSRFTADGLRLQTADLSMLQRKSIPETDLQQRVSPYPVAGVDTLPNVLLTKEKNYAVEDYRPGRHLFNFHSWRPYFEDPEYSFSLYSDNVLSNFSNEIFYRFNQNESSHAVGFNTYYGAWFPVLTAGVSYTMNRNLKLTSHNITWNQMEAKAGYYIPLNFTNGNTYKSLNFGTSLVYNKPQVTGFYKDSFRLKDRQYLQHFLSWSQRLPKSVQQIYPRFGYAVSGNLRHFIHDGGSFLQKAQWLFNGQLSLPAPANHSMVVSGSFQQTDTVSAAFSNRFVNSRGYTDTYFRKMWRISGNYHFPIVYPDWGFANLFYLLRLRGNVFYDYTKVFGGYFSAPPTSSRALRSVGGELYFDSKWWNQLPVSFGVRWSHLLDRDFYGRAAGTNVFEFIVPVDLIPGN